MVPVYPQPSLFKQYIVYTYIYIYIYIHLNIVSIKFYYSKYTREISRKKRKRDIDR